MYVCMYVCMWLNWLECAVGDWQHPGPLGQTLTAELTYNCLSLSLECQFCPASTKYEVRSTKYSKYDVPSDMIE